MSNVAESGRWIDGRLLFAADGSPLVEGLGFYSVAQDGSRPPLVRDDERFVWVPYVAVAK